MDEVFTKVLRLAQTYQPQLSQFLRDLVALPSESCREEKVVLRIREEMKKVGFDRVAIDPMGNVLGYIGHGKHVIAIDAHTDTVGVGNPEDWNYDPFKGYEDEEIILGRGASDQKGGIASAVYGGRIIKELGLEGDYTLIVVGSVQEEDCDGLCWQYILNEDQIAPEFVVITEPTDGRIHRGQRGRMEIKVTTKGRSCHGSAPDRGDNAIYKMAPIILELKGLNERFPRDNFLGKGTLALSEIFFTSPSRCAVADSCWISIDRRLTQGEDARTAIGQIRDLPAVRAANAEVTLYSYRSASYTGLVYPAEAYFPTWSIQQDHPVCSTLGDAFRGLFNKEPVFDKWTFSTNGVSIMGRYGVPCIGFGPGHEDQSHAPNEKTWKKELVQSAAMYAVIPQLYVRKYADQMPRK